MADMYMEQEKARDPDVDLMDIAMEGRERSYEEKIIVLGNGGHFPGFTPTIILGEESLPKSTDVVIPTWKPTEEKNFSMNAENVVFSTLNHVSVANIKLQQEPLKITEANDA